MFKDVSYLGYILIAIIKSQGDLPNMLSIILSITKNGIFRFMYFLYYLKSVL